MTGNPGGKDVGTIKWAKTKFQNCLSNLEIFNIQHYWMGSDFCKSIPKFLFKRYSLFQNNRPETTEVSLKYCSKIIYKTPWENLLLAKLWANLIPSQVFSCKFMTGFAVNSCF